MQTLQFLVFTFAITLGLSNFAHAGLNVSARAAITETKQTVDSLKDFQMQSRLQKVISVIIENGTSALIEVGQPHEAARIRREWVAMQAKVFGPVEDLGDHRPLSQWLVSVYNTMERVLGRARMEALHLDDIKVMNYAIPVVATPKAGWSKSDYSLHFVPFTGVVVYWSSLHACTSAFGGFSYCRRLGEILEKQITSDIAPTLSNYVFDRFNSSGFRGRFVLTEDEIIRRYGREISLIR